MSEPVPGVPDRHIGDGYGVRSQLNSMSLRLGKVETDTAHIPQLVKSMADVEASLATFKSYEATIKGLMGRGIMLIIGAVASAVGVTKGVDALGPSAPIVTPAPTKSASQVRLEAIQAMQVGPERDRALVEFIVETSPVRH